ncbi:DUF4224 domain-containing protein [Burkholderia sp. MSMB1498]|uniref:DUF4224 domain-containing protein n=1 Tax=Burkholderia sp. MSMB1498 TaxID=1637842 RepID=UPI0009E8374A|nr:DUF4224 domain-containing protein [Burkholderia sp. MSMB1498]
MQTTCPRVVLRPLPSHRERETQDSHVVPTNALTLTAREIYEATGYRQPARQLRALTNAGIPADRRPDGSIRVWRHHLSGFTLREPKISRKRPKLTSDMKEITK